QCRWVSISRYTPPGSSNSAAPRFRRSELAFLRPEKIGGHMAARRGFHPGTCAASRNCARSAGVLRRKLCCRPDETRNRTYRIDFKSGILVATRPQMGIAEDDGDWRGATNSSRIACRIYNRTLQGLHGLAQRLQRISRGTSALENLECHQLRIERRRSDSLRQTIPRNIKSATALRIHC